jgi:hypothetical protein
MEQGAVPPPDPPAPPIDEDALAATRGDLRSLRRWLAVAGVWALAATAIAVIALVKASDEGSAGNRADTARQVAGAERALDHRIDSLRSRIDKLPTAQDLSRVDRRLKRAEDDAKRASADSKRVSSRVDGLSRRVGQLEKSQSSRPQRGKTNTSGGSP